MELKKVTLFEAYEIADKWYARAVSLLHYGLDLRNPQIKRRKALQLFGVMRDRVTALLFLILKARSENMKSYPFEAGGIVADGINNSPFVDGGKKVIAMRRRDQTTRSWITLNRARR